MDITKSEKYRSWKLQDLGNIMFIISKQISWYFFFLTKEETEEFYLFMVLFYMLFYMCSLLVNCSFNWVVVERLERGGVSGQWECQWGGGSENKHLFAVLDLRALPYRLSTTAPFVASEYQPQRPTDHLRGRSSRRCLLPGRALPMNTQIVESVSAQGPK